jgi:hypothetical protein
MMKNKLKTEKEKKKFRELGLIKKSKVVKVKNFRSKSLLMGGSKSAGPTKLSRRVSTRNRGKTAIS